MFAIKVKKGYLTLNKSEVLGNRLILLTSLFPKLVILYLCI